MVLTDTQRKLAEQLLLTVIKRENVIEYNELAQRINPPIFWRQVGREIGEVSKLCHLLGLPLISAKVVNKGQGTAGVGFYGLMSILGIDTEGKSEKDLFKQELKKIRECKEWYKLADHLDLDLDLPRLINDKYDSVTIRNNPSKNNAQSEESTISTQLLSWLLPCNVNKFDIKRAFEKYDEIDWRQTVNYKVGEKVFIYCSIPIQKVVFQTVVQKINMTIDETIDDSEFVIGDFSSIDSQSNKYIRLRLVNYIDRDLLSLDYLKQNGLKQAPQSPMRLENGLLEYIDIHFREAVSIDRTQIYPEELDSEYQCAIPEGAKKQITVNVYERNPLARSECIRIHGCKCVICDFDFGKIYGNEFEGKIHVHHIKPLHKVDNYYEVNPKNDLVPVCPNCHMILHSKKDDVYSVDEVRIMICKNKK